MEVCAQCCDTFLEGSAGGTSSMRTRRSAAGHTGTISPTAKRRSCSASSGCWMRCGCGDGRISPVFDTAIIGLGCAGYTAAIYTARYKLTTLLVGETEGGMGLTAAEVGNWPGDIAVKGPELMERMKAHALSFDAVTHRVRKVAAVAKAAEGFSLAYEDGSRDEARTVIIATGSRKRHLGVPGEDAFAGKGVSYCATCDAFFFRGRTVAVIGGGDSAVEGAAIIAQVAKKVYLVHRRAVFRAEPYWVDRVRGRKNVTFVPERNMVVVLGGDRVTGIRLDRAFGGSDTLPVDGVFIEIGSDPASDIAKVLGCDLAEYGYLKVDAGMATSVAGVFGAGDVTDASNRFAQFATAAGEGAVAANGVFTFLQG